MLNRIFTILIMLIVAVPVFAHDGEPIHTDSSDTVAAEFDIVFSQVLQIGSDLIFHMVVAGESGATIPDVTGSVPDAEVLSYVWPTSLDSSTVGFESDQGILALAVTSHPDFDDTPLWDEDEDGDLANDGAEWHSHWVVLVADEACGIDGLKVRDIPDGETPELPETWPELPILIDSPNYELELTGSEIIVTVPRTRLADFDTFNFDGVTAGLRVNANLHNPFLCVTGVHDIASGDLSLSGISGR